MIFSSVGALRLVPKRISEKANAGETLISTKTTVLHVSSDSKNWLYQITKANQKKYGLWVAVVRSILLELVIHRWILFHNFTSHSLKNHDFSSAVISLLTLPSLRTCKQSYLHNTKCWSNSMDYLRANKMLIRGQKSLLFLLHACFYSLLDFLLPILLLHYLYSQEFSVSQQSLLRRRRREFTCLWESSQFVATEWTGTI